MVPFNPNPRIGDREMRLFEDKSTKEKGKNVNNDFLV